MPDLKPAGPTGEEAIPATSRRGVLRGAAGIGAAGLMAGVLAGAVAAPAGAATKAPSTDDARSAAHDKPLILHIHDARTGVIDVYTGEEHVRFTDHQLATRLAQAAR